MLRILMACLLLVPAGESPAATYRAGPETYLQAIRKLQPGDTLLLAPGIYRNGLPIHNLNGAPDRRIVIRGPRSGKRARFVAREGAHTVSIIDSGWIQIRDLDLDGRDLPVAAVRCEGHARWAHHITLEGLVITGHGTSQNTVGIASFCPAWGWTIRNNSIIGAGTGMYLGQSDGSAPFVGGVIEHNLVVDSIGYNVQIKHQRERHFIHGMPEKPAVTIIRHNVLSKSANSSLGKEARPNLLVGHWPPNGPGAEDMYAIYGNFFYQNPTEALFQGEGNIAFYANVLVNTLGDAVHIQPHNDVPKRIHIFRNTIVAAGNGIRISGGDASFPQQVTANVVFAAVPIAGGEQHGNLTGAFAEASGSLRRPDGEPGRLDLTLKPGAGQVVPEDLSFPAGLPGSELDFEGRRYREGMIGAYAGRARWPLSLERKPALRWAAHGIAGFPWTFLKRITPSAAGAVSSPARHGPYRYSSSEPAHLHSMGGIR